MEVLLFMLKKWYNSIIMDPRESDANSNGALAAQHEKVAHRAEKKFDKGENLFQARGVLAWFAIYSRTQDARARNEAFAESDEHIVDRLAQRGASAEIYEIHYANGAESEVSRAFVRVISRDGVPTDTHRNIDRNGVPITRTITRSLDR